MTSVSSLSTFNLDASAYTGRHGVNVRQHIGDWNGETDSLNIQRQFILVWWTPYLTFINSLEPFSEIINQREGSPLIEFLKSTQLIFWQHLNLTSNQSSMQIYTEFAFKWHDKKNSFLSQLLFLLKKHSIVLDSNENYMTIQLHLSNIWHSKSNYCHR
jgi:hypothetical protein